MTIHNLSECIHHPGAGANLYVRSGSILSRIEMWACRGRDDGPVQATHQGKFFDNDALVEALIGKGIKKSVWAENYLSLLKEGSEFAITERQVPCTAQEKAVLDTILAEEVRWDHYSVLELPLQFLDGMLSKVFNSPKKGLDVLFFRRLGDVWDKGVICSKTASRPDVKLNWKPRDYIYASPQENYAYDISKGSGWELTAQTKGW